MILDIIVEDCEEMKLKLRARPPHLDRGGRRRHRHRRPHPRAGDGRHHLPRRAMSNASPSKPTRPRAAAARASAPPTPKTTTSSSTSSPRQRTTTCSASRTPGRVFKIKVYELPRDEPHKQGPTRSSTTSSSNPASGRARTSPSRTSKPAPTTSHSSASNGIVKRTALKAYANVNKLRADRRGAQGRRQPPRCPHDLGATTTSCSSPPAAWRSASTSTRCPG